MLGLVLSGGGAKGCYQVGAIKEMVDAGIKPDLVAGVSTGNLQASMVAQGRYLKLFQLWQEIKQENIFKKKTFGYLNLAFGAGLYNFKPLYELIKQYVCSAHFEIPFRCGVVCLEDGLYYTITEKHDQLQEFIWASACMPGYAAPVEIAGRHYVDGGVRNMTPLKEAIDAGCNEIILIMCSPMAINRGWTYKGRVIDIAARTLEIVLNEIYNEDLSYMYMINALFDAGYLTDKYKHIKFTLIAPKEDVIDTLDFDRNKLNAGLNRGYLDAQEALSKAGYLK